MESNQQNQENQQLLGQQDKPITVNQDLNPGNNAAPVNTQINTPPTHPPQINAQMNIPQGNPIQVNSQMNFPPGFQNPHNFPHGFPQNYPNNMLNMPPNPQNMPKPEDLFQMQKRMMAGERVNIFNPYQQQQSNAYVLAPQNLPSGNKLIIPFSNCNNIILEVFMIITSLMVVGTAPGLARIYTALVFLIEQFCFLYYGSKRVEIVKIEESKILAVKLINYLGCARKTKEFDLSNVYIDVQIVDRKEGWKTPSYYRLIIINTYKDGISIDLDSSSILKTPVKIFESFEHINAHKFNGEVTMKQTLKEFIGNQNKEESPLSFSINKYMNKQENIFSHFNNFINGITFSKYVKMNDHFFSYYSKEPLKNKLCQGCLSRLTYIFHIYLFPLSFMSAFLFSSKTSHLYKERDLYYCIAFFGYILFIGVLYFLCLGLGICCEKTSQFLRIDMIYSKEFDRLFIGVVKNNKSAYINTYLFKLDEVAKFVIEKNYIYEPGFHLKSIYKGSSLVQDICYINEMQIELEGLIYILNEKLEQNVNSINNNTNSMVNNITNDNAGITDSSTPLIDL